MKILVVEDNIELNKAISKSLMKCSGTVTVDSVYNGEDALNYAMNNDYDILILDLMLPKINGLDVLARLRRSKDCGIIVLTALSDKQTTVNVLRMGADDFMTKPFNNDELVARVMSVYRRKSKTVIKNNYEFKSLVVDYDTTTVTIGGDVVVLPGKMYEVFEYLIRNKNTVITKDRLFNRVWGFDSETVYTVVEVYISKLRKLLEPSNLKKHLITIKNIGYMWDENIE